MVSFCLPRQASMCEVSSWVRRVTSSEVSHTSLRSSMEEAKEEIFWHQSLACKVGRWEGEGGGGEGCGVG